MKKLGVNTYIGVDTFLIAIKYTKYNSYKGVVNAEVHYDSVKARG